MDLLHFYPTFFTRRGPASSGWNYLAFPNDAAPEHSAAMSSSRRHATIITCILWICMKVTNDFEIEVEKRFSKGGGEGSRMVSSGAVTQYFSEPLNVCLSRLASAPTPVVSGRDMFD